MVLTHARCRPRSSAPKPVAQEWGGDCEHGLLSTQVISAQVPGAHPGSQLRGAPPRRGEGTVSTDFSSLSTQVISAQVPGAHRGSQLRGASPRRWEGVVSSSTPAQWPHRSSGQRCLMPTLAVSLEAHCPGWSVCSIRAHKAELKMRLWWRHSMPSYTFITYYIPTWIICVLHTNDNDSEK